MISPAMIANFLANQVTGVPNSQQQPSSPSLVRGPFNNGNGGNYVIPVTMKLINSTNTPPSGSPINGGSSLANNTSGNSLANGSIGGGGFILQQPTPTSPSFLIKTGNNSNENQKSRLIEDEVDLFKDLLIKNLNLNSNNLIEAASSSGSSNNVYGVCVRCNERVIGAENGIKAMDCLFHVACFSCFSCGSGLLNQNFYAMDGNAFCEDCYMVSLTKE